MPLAAVLLPAAAGSVAAALRLLPLLLLPPLLLPLLAAACCIWVSGLSLSSAFGFPALPLVDAVAGSVTGPLLLPLALWADEDEDSKGGAVGAGSAAVACLAPSCEEPARAPAPDALAPAFAAGPLEAVLLLLAVAEDALVEGALEGGVCRLPRSLAPCRAPCLSGPALDERGEGEEDRPVAEEAEEDKELAAAAATPEEESGRPEVRCAPAPTAAPAPAPPPPAPEAAATMPRAAAEGARAGETWEDREAGGSRVLTLAPGVRCTVGPRRSVSPLRRGPLPTLMTPLVLKPLRLFRLLLLPPLLLELSIESPGGGGSGVEVALGAVEDTRAGTLLGPCSAAATAPRGAVRRAEAAVVVEATVLAAEALLFATTKAGASRTEEPGAAVLLAVVAAVVEETVEDVVVVLGAAGFAVVEVAAAGGKGCDKGVLVEVG